MASSGHQYGHLDATAGRDVVFCHACNHEWYHDEHGLECPACGEDITEIVGCLRPVGTKHSLTILQVTAENDPRGVGDMPSPSDSDDHMSGLHGHSLAPDPEEADIEEQVNYGPQSFVLRRTIFSNSPQPEGFGRSRPDREPIDPGDGDEIIRRFIDMVNGFGMGPPQGARAGGQDLSRTTRGTLMDGTNFQRTTFSSGPLGTTSVTIATGPMSSFAFGPPGRSPGGGGSDFQS